MDPPSRHRRVSPARGTAEAARYQIGLREHAQRRVPDGRGPRASSRERPNVTEATGDRGPTMRDDPGAYSSPPSPAWSSLPGRGPLADSAGPSAARTGSAGADLAFRPGVQGVIDRELQLELALIVDVEQREAVSNREQA